MRLIFALALLPFPALAWEFSPVPICTLSHTSGDVDIVITYDPDVPIYALSVTLEGQTWDDGPFSMVFEGGLPRQIGTDRQVISNEGRTLTVTDRGFDNVLHGLGTGTGVSAIVGQSSRTVSLDGIGPALADFWACPADTPALS